jgi:hypothetical protein
VTYHYDTTYSNEVSRKAKQIGVDFDGYGENDITPYRANNGICLSSADHPGYPT